MLRDLREEYSSSLGAWKDTSRAFWLTSVVTDFERRIGTLAKQKSELTLQEERTERAALGTETEDVRLL